jgi:hypothetical protein
MMLPLYNFLLFAGHSHWTFLGGVIEKIINLINIFSFIPSENKTPFQSKHSQIILQILKAGHSRFCISQKWAPNFLFASS